MKINLSQIADEDLQTWKEQITAEIRIREKRSQPTLVIDALKDKRALTYIKRHCSHQGIKLEEMKLEDLARLTVRKLVIGEAKRTISRINKVLTEHGYDPLK